MYIAMVELSLYRGLGKHLVIPTRNKRVFLHSGVCQWLINCPQRADEMVYRKAIVLNMRVLFFKLFEFFVNTRSWQVRHQRLSWSKVSSSKNFTLPLCHSGSAWKPETLEILNPCFALFILVSSSKSIKSIGTLIRVTSKILQLTSDWHCGSVGLPNDKFSDLTPRGVTFAVGNFPSSFKKASDVNIANFVHNENRQWIELRIGNQLIVSIVRRNVTAFGEYVLTYPQNWLVHRILLQIPDAFVRKLFRLIHGIMANVARDGGNNSLSTCVS